MNVWWKWLVSLFVAIPLAAYVAGSLAAADLQPRPRPPIVIDASTSSPAATPEATETPGRTARKSDGTRPETVRPEPEDLDPDNSGPGSVEQPAADADGDAGHDGDDASGPVRDETPSPSPSGEDQTEEADEADEGEAGEDDVVGDRASDSPSPSQTSSSSGSGAGGDRSPTQDSGSDGGGDDAVDDD